MLLLCLGLSSCTPAACNEEESVVGKEVEILIGEAGPGVREAERRLLARGHSALAILETGLYQADAIGRGRIVRVLGELHDAEAVPVLRQIAEHDEDASVREQALAVLKKAQSAGQ